MPGSSRRFVASAVAVVAVLMATTSCSVDLEVGGTASMVHGSSANGYLAGWSDAGPQVGTSFVRTPAGEVQRFGNLGESSSAVAVNNSGTAAGVSGDGPVANPFRWSSSSGIEWLDLDGDTSGVARAINDAGVAAGWSDGPTGMTPTVWEVDGTRVLLDIPGGDAGTVMGLNNNGIAVGWIVTEDNWYRAAWWDLDSGTAHVLEPGTTKATSAAAINDDGLIVGWVQDRFTGVSLAAVWAPETHTRTDLPDGRNATAVNANGTVVGYSGVTTHAIAWDAGTFLPHDLGGMTNDSSVATGISSQGRVVGYDHDTDGALRGVEFFVT